jgi:hypothetical protein
MLELSAEVSAKAAGMNPLIRRAARMLLVNLFVFITLILICCFSLLSATTAPVSPQQTSSTLNEGHATDYSFVICPV